MTGRSSVYAFVEDLRGEGVGPVLDRVLDDYGCQGLTAATAYHRARDVTPHGPSRVTLRQDGLHLPVPADLFDGHRLVPRQQAADGADLLSAARRATSERGADLHGWTVFLHNTSLGLAFPETTQENCFGDRAAPADLCPAHPEVRRYAVALARTVARLGVDSVVAESLHYGFFGHGYHHERSFVDLGAVAEFALGLCFCEYCRAQAEASGVDASRARADAARAVSRVLDTGEPIRAELSPEALGPDVARYISSRTTTVTSLTAEVAQAVAAEGSQLVFLDVTGALLGYADGQPVGEPAAAQTWRIGVDPAAVAEASQGYAILGYARAPERIAHDTAAYRAAIGPGRELRTVLRPGLPDTRSADELAAKVQAASAAADAVDFYNYGMSPFPVLDRIPEALGAAR